MADSVSWGGFALRKSTAGALQLHDPSQRVWDVGLSGYRVTALMHNWFIRTDLMNRAADFTGGGDSRQRASYSMRFRTWLRDSLAYARGLSDGGDPLGIELLSTLKKLEQNRNDHDAVVQCLVDRSDDPCERDRELFLAFLWTFDRLRRVCNEIDGCRISLVAALTFLLVDFPTAVNWPLVLKPHWRPSDYDVANVAKRLQRFDDQICKSRRDDVVTSVLQLVTQGPFRPETDAETDPLVLVPTAPQIRHVVRK